MPFPGLMTPRYISAQSEKEKNEEENSMLAFLGFLTVVLMLVLIMTKKASPLVALIAVPVVTGIALRVSRASKHSFP